MNAGPVWQKRGKSATLLDMQERYKLIPEVFLMLVKDGKILLSRRYQTGWMDGYYGLPAGHGEDEETMREGAAREAKEEIGIDIHPADLAFVMTQHRWTPGKGAHARVGFYFVPRKYAGEPTNNEPDKCDDLRWFPFDALPENTIDHIRAVIEAYHAGERYCEHNWETRA